MKRKINVNGYTYQISIPKHWVELNNLSSCSEVNLEIDAEGNLIIKKPLEIKDEFN